MYIVINERESERERERKRKRERERERKRERESERDKERERERERERRERPNTTLYLDGESLTKRQKSGKKIYPTIFPCVDLPAPTLSVFHGNLPQVCDTTSLMFIMRNLFPP